MIGNGWLRSSLTLWRCLYIIKIGMLMEYEKTNKKTNKQKTRKNKQTNKKTRLYLSGRMLAALPPKPWSWNLEIHPACNRGHVSAWRHRGSGREWRFGHTLRGSWCHLQCTHKVQLTSSAITQRRHLHNVPVTWPTMCKVPLTSLRCTKSQWRHQQRTSSK